MRTIKIKEFGDVVYFLDSNGFQKGKIKETRVASDKYNPLSILYFIVTKGDHENYMGAERKPDQIFDTKEEMIDFYSAAKL